MAPNTNMIAITVNGETRRVPENTSIAHLARMLELDPAKVAVEHNGTIAPRSELGQHPISDGDTLEIVLGKLRLAGIEDVIEGYGRLFELDCAAHNAVVERATRATRAA